MRRTQIYLTRRQRQALERRSRETGLSVAALIRGAVDEKYLGRARLSREERLQIVRETAGAWTDRGETGAEYVDRVRPGKLGRLHGLV